MQCKVSTDTTIPLAQAHPGETFVHQHRALDGVVLSRIHPPLPQLPSTIIACVVIASARPEFMTGQMVVLTAVARVTSVAPRAIPEFVAMEG